MVRSLPEEISMIKAIIFDWGRTLHDPERDVLFEGAQEILGRLAGKYHLSLVSLAKSNTPEDRRKQIDDSGIAHHFQEILVGGEDKDSMYDHLVTKLGFMPSEIAMVDDRVVRGIAWGNRTGATTIWMRRGKFADELPTPETKEPTKTITDLMDLAQIF